MGCMTCRAHLSGSHSLFSGERGVLAYDKTLVSHFLDPRDDVTSKSSSFFSEATPHPYQDERPCSIILNDSSSATDEVYAVGAPLL